MNDDYILYAKKLSELGEKITTISQKFLDIKIGLNKDELIIRRNICLKSIEEYKDCKQALLGISSPIVIKSEHEEMIKAFQLFVEATEYMFKSIDIDNSTINIELAKKGMLLQEKGKNDVMSMIDVIVKKLME